MEDNKKQALTEEFNAEENSSKEMTLEQAFARLDELSERLEQNDITLEEGFELYREGISLIQLCNRRIDTVEKKMLQVNQNGELTEFSE